MKSTDTNRRRAGFTLVEMLVVLAILVLLISMVVPRILGSKKKADLNAAKVQIGMYKAALKSYFLACNQFPTTDQGLAALVAKPSDLDDSVKWDGPYVDGEIGKDPWGNDYQYVYPPERGTGDEPDIWSYGPDGEDNTEDDICSWTTGSPSDQGDTGKGQPGATRNQPRTDSRSQTRRDSSMPRRSSPARSTTPRSPTRSGGGF